MYDKLRKIREERAEDDRGFTLIELLVVVVIIGILIAIAIPLYLNYQKGAHDKAAQSDMKAAVTALQQCYTDNANSYTYTNAGTAVTFPATYTSNASITCGSSTEEFNLSSGTTLVVKVSSDGTSFTVAASNSGGHHNDSSAAASAVAAGSGYYFYDSTKGGSIS